MRDMEKNLNVFSMKDMEHVISVLLSDLSFHKPMSIDIYPSFDMSRAINYLKASIKVSMNCLKNTTQKKVKSSKCGAKPINN